MTIPRLLDAKEVAERFGIPVDRVYRLGKRGIIPTVRITRGQVRYREDDLLAWLERNTSNGDGRKKS